MGLVMTTLATQPEFSLDVFASQTVVPTLGIANTQFRHLYNCHVT